MVVTRVKFEVCLFKVFVDELAMCKVLLDTSGE
jgi:hypothetical protein